jgi:hypothetical protein
MAEKSGMAAGVGICPNCGVDLTTLNPMANLIPHWEGRCAAKPVPPFEVQGKAAGLHALATEILRVDKYASRYAITQAEGWSVLVEMAKAELSTLPASGKAAAPWPHSHLCPECERTWACDRGDCAPVDKPCADCAMSRESK